MEKLHAKPVEAAKNQKECDLVMKGGVTSGIVYPAAVQELHNAGYQFRNIGGTSAGAIAAGLTAAAQYGRTQGFQRLTEISGQFMKDGFLLNLFQPSTPAGRTLFRVLMAYLDGAGRTVPQKSLSALAVLCSQSGKRIAQGAALGFAVGALPLLLAMGASGNLGPRLASSWWLSLVGGAVGAGAGGLLGALAGGVEAVPRLLSEVLSEKSFFGICWGHGRGKLASRDGELTDWLCWAID